LGSAPPAVVVPVLDGVELLQAAASKPKLVAIATIIILRFERPINETPPRSVTGAKVPTADVQPVSGVQNPRAPADRERGRRDGVRGTTVTISVSDRPR
jgi:hypothetical protein